MKECDPRVAPNHHWLLPSVGGKCICDTRTAAYSVSIGLLSAASRPHPACPARVLPAPWLLGSLRAARPSRERGSGSLTAWGGGRGGSRAGTGAQHRGHWLLPLTDHSENSQPVSTTAAVVFLPEDPPGEGSSPGVWGSSAPTRTGGGKLIGDESEHTSCPLGGRQETELRVSCRSPDGWRDSELPQGWGCSKFASFRMS